MVEKLFVSAESLLLDSFRLGRKILDSGYQPNFIAALWRGGTTVGMAVQELLTHCNIPTDHIAIRTSRYPVGIDKPEESVKVYGLDYIVERANASDSLLIVDDVYDTGLSIKAVIDTLQERMRKNIPQQIKVATVYYKPLRNKTLRQPDYFIHETESWIIFPHELQGLDGEELRTGKGLSIYEMLKK